MKVLGLAAIAAYCLSLATSRFQVDELEAIHTAWKIASGERIYVDFFQHHNPLFYYLLAPLVQLGADGDLSLVSVRLVAGCFGLLTVYATWRLSLELAGTNAAWMSTTLVLANGVALGVGADVRPDVPQVALSTLSILCAFLWLDRRTAALLIGSAVLMGLAFMFLQKAVIPGFALGAVWLLRVLRGELKLRWLFGWGVTVCATIALCLLPYAATDSLQQWYDQNIVLNTLSDTPNFALETNQVKNGAGRIKWLLLPLLLIPVLWFLKGNDNREKIRRDSRWAALELFIIALFVGGVAVTYRVQYFQYYLNVLPILAVLGAWSLCSVISAFANRRATEWSHTSLVYALPIISCCILSLGALSRDYSTEDLAKQTKVLDLIRATTAINDSVYDERMLCNLFRKDLHFFWFSVGDGQQLEKYRKIHALQHSPDALMRDQRTKVACHPQAPKLKDRNSASIFEAHPSQRDLYVRRTRKPAISQQPALEIEKAVNAYEK